jgi:hypothetical protein
LLLEFDFSELDKDTEEQSTKVDAVDEIEKGKLSK